MKAIESQLWEELEIELDQLLRNYVGDNDKNQFGYPEKEDVQQRINYGAGDNSMISLEWESEKRIFLHDFKHKKRYAYAGMNIWTYQGSRFTTKQVVEAWRS